jgi:hypothetical protein
MTRFFSERPWIWIVLFFLSFLLLWTWFIFLAVENTPAVVPSAS